MLPTEPHVILSIARVLATPVEAARPPWVRVSTGIGGDPGPGGFGEVAEQVQVPPTSDGLEWAWP